MVSAADFSPDYFHGLSPRLVSYYAFFKGWLLLSQPPNCFRKKTHFEITLNQHLRALTIVWVVSLSEQELTPCPLLQPSMMIMDWEFDKKGGTFEPLLSNQYLYPTIFLWLG